MRKNTKYLCNLENRNGVHKATFFVPKSNGDVMHDSEIIKKEARRFYENLYASRDYENGNLYIKHAKIVRRSK